QTGFAQNAPNPSHAGIVLNLENSVLRHIQVSIDEFANKFSVNGRLGRDPHGAEFQEHEGSAQMADPFLAKQYRALGTQLDGCRNQKEKRQKNNECKAAERDIDHPLPGAAEPTPLRWGLDVGIELRIHTRSHLRAIPLFGKNMLRDLHPDALFMSDTFLNRSINF